MSAASRFFAAALAAMALVLPAFAQEQEAQTIIAPALESHPAANFDTSYRPSPTVSSRNQREFLDNVRWSSGVESRDNLAAAFEERKPVDIWQELVAEQGLEAENVADALTAYWVLNWVTANRAYTAEIDNAPIRRQVRVILSRDPNFSTMGDQQRQQLAEGYMFNFLFEHAALNQAVAARDVTNLNRLAAASVARFQRNMGVNLLALVPSAEGFEPRPRP